MMYQPLVVREYGEYREMQKDYGHLRQKFFNQAAAISRRSEQDKLSITTLRNKVKGQLDEMESLLLQTQEIQEEIDGLKLGLAEKGEEVNRLLDEAGGEIKVKLTKLHFQKAIRVIAEVHNVRIHDIKGMQKSKELVGARRHLIHILSTHRKDLSLPLIGRLLGGRHHTTVLHARNSWDKFKGDLMPQVIEVAARLGLPVDSAHNPLIESGDSPCSDKIVACG